MNLVIFDDALFHLLRMTRVINSPAGNILLVGVGGSGKQSLTKLASFCCKQIFFQISLTKTYNENNLNFVVYDNRSQNEKVAMPNKFYESGFFNIPIVAANETYVGQRVLDQGLGWTCGISFEEISKFLTELQIKDIVQTHENIKKLDKSSFEA